MGITVFVMQIIHSKAMSGEIWITSDGRAYLASLQGDVDQEAGEGSDQSHFTVSRFVLWGLCLVNFHQGGNTESVLHHSDLRWLGTCIHDFHTPRWVQKQRWIEPDSDVTHLVKPYVESRRATCVAINSKFSLIAIGTCAGAFHLTNFPSEMGVVPKSQKIEIPSMFSKPTGEVTALDWSSDGYVLAVGWEQGWGIFSVGGKCLAFGVGVNEVIDEGKYVEFNYLYRWKCT